jgi:PAS domain S-box-containing protein
MDGGATLTTDLPGFRQMIDSITDYEVILLDLEGRVRSWHPGAERLTGYQTEEILGRPLATFFTEDDARSGLAARELDAAAREGRFETEGWRVRKDGSRFWASVVLAPIRDELGTVQGFVEVARDQSERREQELVLRGMEQMLDAVTDYEVIRLDPDGPIIGTLDSLRAARLTESLLERISLEQAEVVIMDVSGVPAIDTDVAQHLLKTVEAARLMGTVSVLSGVRPETAQAMVHLGIDLGSLRCRTTLKEALQLALQMVDALSVAGRAGDHD